jgi:hypothetical protein
MLNFNLTFLSGTIVLMQGEQQPEWGTMADPATNSEPRSSLPQEISWSASEFIAHQKSTSWFLVLAAGSFIVLGLVYWITKGDLFSVTVIGFVCGAIGVYANRKPNIINYKLSHQGIQIADKTYSYNDFKAFSVIEEGAIACVWLRPLKRIMPTVAMYLDPQSEENIIDTLLNYLPEEERQHDVIDRLSNKFRF